MHTTIASQHTTTKFADDRRKQIAEEQAEVNAEKARNLVLQRSLDCSPERRIALWEARHGLMLPSAAHHPLIAFIAESTNLEPPQIEAEQQRRRELQEQGMEDGAQAGGRHRSRSDQPHADPTLIPGALTPQMNQDQLQTWEGEGGSTAPIPAPDRADVTLRSVP